MKARNTYKISIVNTQYVVNEEKGIVTCILTVIPRFTFCDAPMYKVIGKAQLSPNDVFDVEKGKKVALAKAEIEAYNEYKTILTKLLKMYNKEVSQIKDFLHYKLVNVISHNKEYINKF